MEVFTSTIELSSMSLCSKAPTKESPAPYLQPWSPRVTKRRFKLGCHNDIAVASSALLLPLRNWSSSSLTLITSAWSQMLMICSRAFSADGHKGSRRLGSYESRAPAALASFIAVRCAVLHGSTTFTSFQEYWITEGQSSPCARVEGNPVAGDAVLLQDSGEHVGELVVPEFSNEGGVSAEPSDSDCDVRRSAAGSLDESRRLRQRYAGDSGDEVDQHWGARH
ncbi:hypothetical protein Cgig2_026077 [Carnegiea gigantea]|uniref:Uncharacterized protein n=1 Tax=Carnegiea gigantea TaxID=171969 RepID=A0A9Q1KMM9_9CARY|nr:hypothetical protein Cgig2_026077 [Carnegiea gigantea]